MLRAAHPHPAQALPCLCESASGGNQIRHTVTSGFAPRYARYIADAEIVDLLFFSRTLINARKKLMYIRVYPC